MKAIHLIASTIYILYIYFFSGAFFVVLFFSILNPHHVIEGFHIVHNSILEAKSVFTSFIVYGFMIEAIIRLSAIKASWDLEKWIEKVFPYQYKKWSTIIGASLSFGIVFSTFFLKLF
ncbi:hypothetical protein KKA33_04540 [Patescibacteria group bacterium]|nr:hypothetical protein [Patescibacteria group bacterium]